MSNRLITSVLLISLMVAGLALNIFAAVPGLISYQGRVTTSAGQPVADGAYFIRFQIYDAPVGGTSLWNSNIQPVQVKDGVYTYILGQDVPFPNGLFTGGNRWLGVTIGVDSEMTPRQQMIATGYAFVSQNADSVGWSGIKNMPAGFADGIDDVGVGDITAVNTSGGLTGGVTSGDANISIASGGVTSSHIANSTIVDADISPTANIAAIKINGTAATLSGANTFSSTNTFTGMIQSCDSVMRVDCNGISIGRSIAPSTAYLLQSQRNFNTTGARYGHYIHVENTGTGQLFGTYSRAISSTADDPNSGPVYGSYSLGASDNSSRYGSFSTVSARTAQIGTGISYGVYGSAYDGATAYGVYGVATNVSGHRIGVYGTVGGTSNYISVGVKGETVGVVGGIGVLGEASESESSAIGVRGLGYDNGTAGFGVYGNAYSNSGTGYGVYGLASSNSTNWSGYFFGDVNVTGTIFTPVKSTRIDHPLDPENKFLLHATIESTELLNQYSGNVTLDATGMAIVLLPDWFEAANKDVRYQLTCIGGYAPIYIAEKVSGNKFKIAGGTPALEVSWQISAVRNDQYSNSHPFTAVKEKRPNDRGKYLYPATFGFGDERSIDYEDRMKLQESPNSQQDAESQTKTHLVPAAEEN